MVAVVDREPVWTGVDYARRAFVNSVTRILNSWPAALNDANARGYPTRLGDPGDRGESTSVEVAALARSDAREWLKDLDRTLSGVVVLANHAALLWPPPARPGVIVAGVTVGRRGNNVETCGLCGDPVSGGHADPIRRIDGQAFHGKRCWFTVARQRTLT